MLIIFILDTWHIFGGIRVFRIYCEFSILIFSVSGDVKFWDMRKPGESYKTIQMMDSLSALDVHPYADILAW